MKDEIVEFLQQSNYIEKELSDIALDDAILAWEFAYKNKDKINLDYVLEIHKLLMKRLRPDIAGKWRHCDVFIGGNRKIFISEALIKTDVQQKVLFEMLAKGNFDKECKVYVTHVRFEKIHPFEDGNGRVGRILWQIHRLKLNLPIKIIYEENKFAYYKWFQ